MSTVNHPALLGEFPVFTRTEHQASCNSAWWHGCAGCEADNSARLDDIRAWAESAYDLSTTGVLTLTAEVSRWSDSQRRFVWVERKPQHHWYNPNRRIVTGYRFCDSTGEATFYDITHVGHTHVWSRMGAGDAGYAFLVPPSDITTLPIRHGERNKKGYPSLRYTSCVFTPFADLPDNGGFRPLVTFGNSRDWSRAYND